MKRKVYNVIDIINSRINLSRKVIIMPNYIKAGSVFYPHGVRRGGTRNMDGKFAANPYRTDS